MLGCRRACVDVEHAAGTERCFRRTGDDATLADERRLLIADHREDRGTTGQRGRFSDPAHCRHDARQERRVDVQRVKHAARPLVLRERRMIGKPGDCRVRRVGGVHGKVAEYRGNPRVDGAGAGVRRARSLDVRCEPHQLRRRLVGCEHQILLGTKTNAVAHGAQVLPAESGCHRRAGARVPHDGRGALSGDADCAHVSTTTQSRVRDSQHGVAHGNTVELHQPGERARRRQRLVREAGDARIVAHHRGAQARGADVDDEHAHDAATSLPRRSITETPPRRERSAGPACPG